MNEADDKHSFTFHIGLHKTGTTFLQKEVFLNMEEVHLVRGKIRELFGYSRSTHRVELLKENILVSLEALAGYPWQGKWTEEFYFNIKNISSLFPGSNCIVGFRRHDRMVLSMYKQWLKMGNSGSIDDYFSIDGSGLISTQELKFEDRIRALDEKFERVFVYTQEELVNDFDSFLTDIKKFLGLSSFGPKSVERKKYNVGVRTQVQMKMLRRLNKWDEKLQSVPFLPTLNNSVFRSLRITPNDMCLNRLRWMGKLKASLPPETETYLQEEYADDWAYVQQRVENRL